MRTIIWFIYFWAELIRLLPALRRAEKLRAANDAEADVIVQREVPRWANKLLRLAGVTVEVHGRENIPAGGACVFIANHRSYYDIPLMLTQLGTAPALVAKIETDRIPLIRRWMRLLRCVFLDRDNPRQALAAMNEATENLKAGHSVVIFPEGTRGKAGELDLGEFKAGAYRMATKSRCPIVPIAIHGSRDVMENNGNWMRPGHVVIRILPAIPTEGLDKQAQKALPEQTREAVLGALREMQ